MKIVLFDTNKTLCDSWCIAFEDLIESGSSIVVENKNLNEIEGVDCFITPGNSFGSMSGGIDLAFRDKFGYQLQDVIQLGIMQHTPFGLPVGDTLVVKGEDCADVMYAPTMRVPSPARPLDIAFVMSAIIVSLFEYDYKCVAIPGLGTGAGNLNTTIAANMMRCGYDTAMKLLSHMKEVVKDSTEGIIPESSK